MYGDGYEYSSVEELIKKHYAENQEERLDD